MESEQNCAINQVHSLKDLRHKPLVLLIFKMQDVIKDINVAYHIYYLMLWYMLFIIGATFE